MLPSFRFLLDLRRYHKRTNVACVFLISDAFVPKAFRKRMTGLITMRVAFFYHGNLALHRKKGP